MFANNEINQITVIQINDNRHKKNDRFVYNKIQAKNPSKKT